MKKRVTSLLFVLALTLSTFIIATSAYSQSQDELSEQVRLQCETDAEIDARRGEGFAENQRQAIGQLDEIYGRFMRLRGGDIMFPEYFGGMYISDDGQAAVLFVESMIDRAMEYSHIEFIMDLGVNYRLVEFSYGELRRTQTNISSIVNERTINLGTSEQWCVYACNAMAVTVCVINNHVIVRILEYNNQMIDGFKRYVYDSPLIRFKQGSRLYIGGPPAMNPFVIVMIFMVACMFMVISILIFKRNRYLRWLEGR